MTSPSTSPTPAPTPEKTDPSVLEVLIVNPDKIIYEGKAKRVFVPGPFGDAAMLPQHTPMYSELVNGMVKIEESSGEKIEKKIEGGVVRTKQNSVRILVGF